jgi:hypothetical protein
LFCESFDCSGDAFEEGIDLLFLVAGRFLGKGDSVVVVVNPGGLGSGPTDSFFVKLSFEGVEV